MKSALRILLILLSPTLLFASQADKPSEPPSDTEIKLALAEAKHAFEQYKTVIAHGEQLLGKDVFQQDRMLLDHWETTSKAVTQNPQSFDSELGFDLLMDLDDAARNTALCADQSSTLVLNDINNLHSQKSQLLLELHQSCMDSSKSLFAASENTNVLFLRYVKWQKQAAAQAAEAAARCADALKKAGNQP